MLSLPANINVYLAACPTDFRKSFDGLAAIVENQFGMSACTGDLFVFLNKRGTQVRLLFWERNGLCLVAKKLEAGTFRRVKESTTDGAYVEIDALDLAMLLEGVEAKIVRRSKRFVRKTAENRAA